MPFWALVAFTFILLLAPQTFFPALAPLRLARLTGLIAISAYLWDRLIHRRPLMRFTPEMWVVACLVGWAVLTVPLAYWPGGSAQVLVDLYFKALVVFWLLSNTVNTLTKLRRVAWMLSLTAVPLAAAGVQRYLLGSFMGGNLVKRIVGYDAPLTENPNDLALMLNLILPLTIALFLLNRRPVVRPALGLAIFLNVITVILTFSRAGFLTLTTIFVMYLWKHRRQAERRGALAWLLLALLVLSIPFIPSGYVDRVRTITDIDSDPTGSAQSRWNDMVTAVRFVLRNPIVGAGAGVEALALNEERGPLWREVHNVYLQYAVGLGIPGLALFLSLLVGCVKSAQLAQSRSAGMPALRELFYLAEGIEVSLLAFAVAALFYPVAYHFYFYYFAGLAIALRMVAESRP